MLSDTFEKLLGALARALPEEGFRIVEGKELFAELSAEEISRAVGLLEAQGFLEVRYAEGDAYCLRLLPAARAYLDREQKRREEEARFLRRSLLFSAVGAFSGGALAGAFSFLLSLWV